jgi:hypothetical protein
MKSTTKNSGLKLYWGTTRYSDAIRARLGGKERIFNGDRWVNIGNEYKSVMEMRHDGFWCPDMTPSEQKAFIAETGDPFFPQRICKQ